MKIIKCTHVTQTEKKHLKVLFESGKTSAKINNKSYHIIKGTPIKGGYEYEIDIFTPYIRESTKQREFNKQRIIVQTL